MKSDTKNLRQTGSVLAIGANVRLCLGQRTNYINKTSNVVTSSSGGLIEATNEYKASSKELLTIHETEVSKAAAKLEELRTLVSEGLVAKSELEVEEQKLVDLRGKVQATQKQIADSDTRVAEIKAEQELARKQATAPVKLIAKQYGTLSTTAMMLRYNGPVAWSRDSLDTIQNFFGAKFGHSLPTSAVGQSATHNRLGYDHRNAVDVALHPDSTEGPHQLSAGAGDHSSLFAGRFRALQRALIFT